MALYNPFRELHLFDLFETLLPDFVLAFTFFTALTYAILGKRFGHQRPAIAMSAALGLALSAGLVWWEHDRGWSVRQLGPVALGFAVIVLGMLMYQSIRQVGGTWAGAGIAIGASILVAWALDIPWPFAREILQALVGVALIVGIVAFLIHTHGRVNRAYPLPAAARHELADRRHDMSDLYRNRRVGKSLRRGLKRARHETADLGERPDAAPDIMRQLQRMLPAEGWLTQRLAGLRAKAHFARKGHVARIEEIRQALSKLPPEAKKRASQELVTRYGELKLDTRLERLDKMAAENERRVRILNREAQAALQRSDHRRLADLLKQAEKLQKHGSALLGHIQRTERKLGGLAKRIARQPG